MISTFQTTRRVEFRDTDAAGLAHFSAFFVWMEEAEHEFLRHLGYSVLMHDEQGKLSWPRVAASCQFSEAARFEDVLAIRVAVGRVGEKSVTYVFTFERAGRTIAQGELATVCCRLEDGGPPRSVPIPDAMREKLDVYAVRKE
jgi:4-hydroxybenzoyl-CoA thioesterase/acyl-CoA thioester hydrolase